MAKPLLELRMLLAERLLRWAAAVAPVAHPDGLSLNLMAYEYARRVASRGAKAA